jgi:primosomal protein N' (replication factor Y)
MANGIARRELITLFAGAGKALKGLEAKGLVTVEEKTLYRNPFGEELLAAAEPIALTAEQQVALDIVLPYLRRKKFTPFLLHGVTGSGKTEIYLRAAAATLQESRSVLVLVPEIALATQLESCFLSRFGDQVALLHSGLSPGEFYDQWQRILQGKARVVIGARSAVFAPLADPGLIVVDEEHDSSYKQDDGFRYHARDIAVLRASQSGSVVLLGSATPSISSKFNAETGKYRLLTLNKRINERPLPAVEIVDLRAIKTVSGRPPLFSNQLVKALKNNLRDGKQSLIFLNRRGYASMVLCNDCGNSVQCIHCRVSLTLHQASSRLLCHYCGYSVPRAVICPDCGSSHVVEVGFGTERIEQELAQIVPTARLARLDRDTCLKRHDYIRVLKGMHEHRVDILIGTQMIAKGHHFPLVTLVGIIWADVGLSVPDFRAAERTYQLLSQVTGRAGRGADPGRVIIQTHQPDHYGISLARQHDYEALYQREIALRRQLGYPPFARLINFRIEGSKERQVEKIAAALASSAEQLIKKGRATVKILGPAPAPLALLRGKFRWQLLLMGSERKVLHDCSISLLRQTANLATAQRVKVSLDIDPENLL